MRRVSHSLERRQAVRSEGRGQSIESRGAANRQRAGKVRLYECQHQHTYIHAQQQQQQQQHWLALALWPPQSRRPVDKQPSDTLHAHYACVDTMMEMEPHESVLIIITVSIKLQEKNQCFKKSS